MSKLNDVKKFLLNEISRIDNSYSVNRDVLLMQMAERQAFDNTLQMIMFLEEGVVT